MKVSHLEIVFPDDVFLKIEAKNNFDVQPQFYNAYKDCGVLSNGVPLNVTPKCFTEDKMNAEKKKIKDKLLANIKSFYLSFINNNNENILLATSDKNCTLEKFKKKECQGELLRKSDN